MEAANAKKMKHITTMLLNPRAAPLLVPVYANMPVRVDKSGRLFFVNLRLSDLAPSLIRLGAVPGSGGQPSAADHDAASRGFEVYTRPHTRVSGRLQLVLVLTASAAPYIHIYMLAYVYVCQRPDHELEAKPQEEEAGAATGLQQLPQESKEYCLCCS